MNTQLKLLDSLLEKMKSAEALSSINLLPRIEKALQAAHRELDECFHLKFLESLIESPSVESNKEILLETLKTEAKEIKGSLAQAREAWKVKNASFMKMIIQKTNKNIEFLGEKFEELDALGVKVIEDLKRVIIGYNPLNQEEEKSEQDLQFAINNQDIIVVLSEQSLPRQERKIEEEVNRGSELLHKTKIEKKYFSLLKELRELKRLNQEKCKKVADEVGEKVYRKIKQKIEGQQVIQGSGSWVEEEAKIEKKLEELKFELEDLKTEQILDCGYHIRLIEAGIEKQEENQRRDVKLIGEELLEAIEKIVQFLLQKH